MSSEPIPLPGLGRAFLRIGILSFGGPAGQIATMHHELVERRRWIDDATFLRALNLCMLIPGPEAQQLATWCGWRLGGMRGGLLAGGLFVLPGALAMAVLTAVYITFGQLGPVRAVFDGVQAAVVAIVALAVVRVAARALRAPSDWTIAALALAATALLAVPFPAIVLGGALAGWLISWPQAGSVPRQVAADPASSPGVQWSSTLRTVCGWTAIWLAPLAVATALLGPHHGLVTLGALFARLAVVSFGGAYAGLAYVTQGGVAGLVTPAEILDGLALAETTPGPLVLVYQFLGGLAGYRLAGPWAPWGGAAIAIAMVVWVTFAPSFLLIFALAPRLEALMARPGLARGLAGVTAAVVGVMASLGLWFTLHVGFGDIGTLRYGVLRVWTPEGPLDGFAVTIAVSALILLTRRRLGMLSVLALAAGAGLVAWSLNAG